MNKSYGLLLYIVILCTLLITSCDEPRIERLKDVKKPIIPAGTMLSFAHTKVQKELRENTYTQEVEKKATVRDDTGAITYESSDPAIATVNESTGEVRFVKAGTVTITARKAGTPDKYKPSTAQYTLVISDALADYDKAIALDPTNAEAYIGRGDVKKKLKDYDGALADYNKAIELDPTSAKAYAGRGDVKNFKGNYDEAIEDYDKATQLDANDYLSFFRRGYLKDNKEEYEDAIADYDKAITVLESLVATDTTYKSDLARVYNARGFAYLQLEEYTKAHTAFDKALSNNNEEARYYFNRATARIKKDEWYGSTYDAALRDYNKAIELDENYYQAYVNRGWLYLNRGKYKYGSDDVESAKKDFEKAVSLKPQGYIVYFNRGVARRKEGNYDDAIADFTKVIGLNPTFYRAYRQRGKAKNQKEVEAGNEEPRTGDADIAKATELQAEAEKAESP